MSGFDYGNARLRAMKSRLIHRSELNTLAESGNLQGLIAALNKTSYSRAVEAALARFTGMACIDECLRDELISSLGKLLRFYEGEAYEQVQLLMRSFDVHNMKVILNGLSKNVPTNEILPGLLPVGTMDYSILAILASEHSPRDAIDQIASMNLPPAQPLLRLRAERPGADIFEMEIMLEQWHYQDAQERIQSNNASGKLLAAALDFEADMVNILTVMRFVHMPSDRSLLQERLGREDIEQLFVGPGQISFDLLKLAENQETIEGAIDKFTNTPYIEALRSGLEIYARSGRLSDIERRLRRYRLDWMTGLIAKDPLGIGVVLGFVALKVNEVNSVRWIAQAIDVGLKAEIIRSEMDLIA